MLTILFLVVICCTLLLGYPIALTLAGASILFALILSMFGEFHLLLLASIPNRIYGIMTNVVLMAIPLFVLMGVTLQESGLAKRLLATIDQLLARTKSKLILKSGTAVSVVLVGGIIAASSGIVGATVVSIGLIALPSLLQRGYSKEFASGSICATGTLGQIIPPSIALVLLGDVISSANQRAQFSLGNYASTPVSVSDLFHGAIIPGVLLLVLYCSYSIYKSKNIPFVNALQQDNLASAEKNIAEKHNVFFELLLPLLLILGVLGSIFAGIATPTEAAAIGAVLALTFTLLSKQLQVNQLKKIAVQTAKTTSMVFFVLVGASIFSLVFRGVGGEETINEFFSYLSLNLELTLLVVMLLIFFLGFILDFIEITYIVVPIVAPVLIAMGADPVWLGILIALNLQTSFITPPFGFAIFYLKGVSGNLISSQNIYKGVVPFVFIQLLVLSLVFLFPEILLTSEPYPS